MSSPPAEPSRLLPFTRPAHQVLDLAGKARYAWAEFDPGWYLRVHPDLGAALPDWSSRTILSYYLERGQILGHAPNRWFDEAWYRQTYPEVLDEPLRTRDHQADPSVGLPVSGFDHYCRSGFRTNSPHWLFEERPYRLRYSDLTDAALSDAGMANGYDHFLRHGSREQRIGHLFFDPAVYLTQLAPNAAQEAAELGPYQYYLRSIESGRHDHRTSFYFDPEWYLERYPDVADEIAQGLWQCALHHYLANSSPTAFDPLPEFSESYYLDRYPDIKAAVERGDFRNGYCHFLDFGAAERRSPSGAIDLRYFAEHPGVSAALKADHHADPVSLDLRSGRSPSPIYTTLLEETVSEAHAKVLFHRKAVSLLPLFSRRPLDFSYTGTATLSVVMVVHDRFALTLNALGSLRSNFAGGIELVLVDSGSLDETRFISRYVRGAQLLRLESNIGFLRGCNAAFAFASADAVLLLNNDVEVAPGAVEAALARLWSHPSISAVGAKVVRTHGLLQEAGCIIWRDGSTTGYMRDVSPLAPEANFVRDVDFCSAVFLMLRRAVVDRLEGFDDAFAPAYYEDTDLCVRIAADGGRIVYDPAVVVHHLEYGSATSVVEAEAAMTRNRDIFRRKHESFLATLPDPDDAALIYARTAGPRRQRVLFFEDRIPLRSIGSGFVRSNDILHVIASMQYQVTVFPIYPSPEDSTAVFGDMPDTVEVIYDRGLDDLPAFLAARSGFYDVIWIARTHNLNRLLAPLEPELSRPDRPRMILDTEAVASARQAVLACLPGHDESFDYAAALEQEFANASICDHIVAVRDEEAEILRDLGFPQVSVIGHMRSLSPAARPFKERSGMLFVGAIHDMKSPNYEGLCWFVDDVLPLIEQSLGWETRLTVVGYITGNVSLQRFADHPRITLRGMVAETEPLYSRHRIFVAPTRYAAGTPYKVHEAASFGLPIVTTELLCSQVRWVSGVDLLAADGNDPQRFADLVVALYRDEALWQRLRDNALKRLVSDNNREAYTAAIRDALGPGPWRLV